MTVTDQIKILDRKIMQNETQYDLDRKAAKISAWSSNNLDKYEYLTGEYSGYKASVIECAKFEYFPLGKIFTEGMGKDDRKEGLLKRLKNIEDKNQEQLKLISKANKTSSHTKNESDYNCDNNKFAFYKFYRDFQNFKDRSLESKYNDISKFYRALNEFKNHKTNTDETQQRKNRVINNTVSLYNDFDSYKKTCNETFNETTLNEIKTYDPYQFKIASLLPHWLELKNDFNEAKRLLMTSELT